MHHPPDTLPSHLSLPQLQQINDLCDRFEAAWVVGRPAIEEFLGATPEPYLLCQLVLLDIDYRRKCGESPALQDYLARFPTLDRVWLGQVLAESPPSHQATSNPEVDPMEFLNRLAQRGLLTELLPSLRASLASSQMTTEALASRLVTEGKLAAFQARALMAPVAIPFVLGPYVLDGWIAAGGMGYVFRATHAHMKRVVALKVMHASSEMRQRFQREVQVAARLRHLNVVTAFDAGEQDGISYLVTEFVEGEDLGRLVAREGSLAIDRAVAYVRQAAMGLAYAHSQGVVHRDVKPSNLILGIDGVVRVLDVGLARAGHDRSEILADTSAQCIPSTATANTSLTATGTVMGTPDYMAPEQAENSRQADARADVYSLGCTLHFLLTGRPPYLESNAFAVLMAHTKSPIPSLRARRAEIPEALDHLFQQMLAKQPEKRPQSMTALLPQLDAVTQRRFSRRWFLAASAGALLAAAAGGFALYTSRQKGKTSDEPPARPELARIPFNTRVQQRRWSQALGVPVFPETAGGIRFALIPAGIFLMGTPEPQLQQLLQRTKHDLEITLLQSEVQREVTIPNPYYLSTSEITVGQFRRFVKATGYTTLAEKAANDQDAGWGWHPQDGWQRKKGCSWQNTDQFQLQDDHPAGNVTWQEANDYCRWLSEELQQVCRLPTEAEWEFACRAGNAGLWCCGDQQEQLTSYAWILRNSDSVLHQVRSCAHPNALGLYDMHGNLREWCRLPENPVAIDRPPAQLNPAFVAYEPVRGGDFLASPEACRSAARAWLKPNDFGPGFRVLQEIRLS